MKDQARTRGGVIVYMRGYVLTLSSMLEAKVLIITRGLSYLTYLDLRCRYPHLGETHAVRE